MDDVCDRLSFNHSQCYSNFLLKFSVSVFSSSSLKMKINHNKSWSQSKNCFVYTKHKLLCVEHWIFLLPLYSLCFHWNTHQTLISFCQIVLIVIHFLIYYRYNIHLYYTCIPNGPIVSHSKCAISSHWLYQFWAKLLTKAV